MPFKRVWDANCPRVYDRWEGDGATWVIQDLRPEDDEAARNMLMEDFIPDEALCSATGILNDPEGLRSMEEFWRRCLAQRMSLACYVQRGDNSTLAALNCCIVACKDDGDGEICEIEGKGWQNVYNALKYADGKANVFEVLKMDKILSAMGLVVRRDYRGAKLGARMLSARKPLSLAHGVKGTSTVFTGVASQKSAERAGFTTVAEVSFEELAASGLRYPKVDRSIKVMVMRFDDS